MNNDGERKTLSKTAFQIALNTHLWGTRLGDILNKMRLQTDKEGNLPPNVVEAIRLMLRVADKTPIGHVGDSLQFRNMLHFLAPY